MWQCQERYKVKGVQGCSNRHIDEAVLKEAIILAWNRLIDNREEIKECWRRYAEFGNPLEQYQAACFLAITENADTITEFDVDFLLKTLEYIKIYESGKLKIRFMDGTEFELDGN